MLGARSNSNVAAPPHVISALMSSHKRETRAALERIDAA
jgi:hypothetical protein